MQGDRSRARHRRRCHGRRRSRPFRISSPACSPTRIRAEQGEAQLFCANNVFAHIDNMSDVVKGIRLLLADDGAFVFEVSYIVDMIDNMVFDTIYHEHVSHHALIPLETFLNRHDMTPVPCRADRHQGRLDPRLRAAQIDRQAAALRRACRKLIAEEERRGITKPQDLSRLVRGDREPQAPRARLSRQGASRTASRRRPMAPPPRPPPCSIISSWKAGSSSSSTTTRSSRAASAPARISRCCPRPSLRPGSPTSSSSWPGSMPSRSSSATGLYRCRWPLPGAAAGAADGGPSRLDGPLGSELREDSRQAGTRFPACRTVLMAPQRRNVVPTG